MHMVSNLTRCRQWHKTWRNYARLKKQKSNHKKNVIITDQKLAWNAAPEGHSVRTTLKLFLVFCVNGRFKYNNNNNNNNICLFPPFADFSELQVGSANKPTLKSIVPWFLICFSAMGLRARKLYYTFPQMTLASRGGWVEQCLGWYNK